MKGYRRFLAIAAAFLLGTVAFADEDRFGGLIGGGVIVPLQAWNSSDWSDSTRESTIAFDVTYMGIAASNFAGKAEFSIGKPSLADNDLDGKIFMSGGGGLGYAFLNNDRALVAVMGDVKFNFSYYSYEKSGIEIDTMLTHWSFGASIETAFRLAGGFAIYGGLELDYSVGQAHTWLYYNVAGISGSSSGSDSINGFLFAPRVGVAFSW